MLACSRTLQRPSSASYRSIQPPYRSLPHRFLPRSVPYHSARRRYSSKTPPEDSPKDSTRAPLYKRLADTWRDTPTTWYPLPIAVGALLLVVLQWRKQYVEREVAVDEFGREVVRLKGPWHVHVIGALPLRNLSRLWGYLNSLELPVWARPAGFRLYASIFGCNLEEIDPADLTQYTSLGDFFYRKLKDGARPVADAILTSPADGKVLHFGVIADGRVEQIKGSTYSLSALLGVDHPGARTRADPVAFPTREAAEGHDRDFADINGIDYSLDEFLGTTSEKGKEKGEQVAERLGEAKDMSVEPAGTLVETIDHDAEVAAEMGFQSSLGLGQTTSTASVKPGNALFFMVIYLAPGDYHRFHSPAAWVVEKRRHFTGDLFSVSPWMVKRLENLFVLNERVVLLGRWRHGFFSMIPVGATNVGSIKINFDQALRTNVETLRPPPIGTYTEAVYSEASKILNGQPLVKGQEMGGFSLGSTIVLVFEAPQNFEFSVQPGQKVKVGEKLGDVQEATS